MFVTYSRGVDTDYRTATYVLGIDPAFEGIAVLPTVEGKMTTSNDPTERSDGGSLTQSFYPRLLEGLQCPKMQEQSQL